MAREVPLGMEFMNWQNVPSLTESFASMASGKFNPLGYAIGYGLNKALSGENDYISNLVQQQKNAFETQTVAQKPPADKLQPVPAVPSVSSVSTESPVDKYIPSFSGMRLKIGNLFGVQ